MIDNGGLCLSGLDVEEEVPFDLIHSWIFIEFELIPLLPLCTHRVIYVIESLSDL